MAKCLLINPSNYIFGENFNLRAHMRADIRIKSKLKVNDQEPIQSHSTSFPSHHPGKEHKQSRLQYQCALP